jgi:hypothetical protein
MAQIREPFFTTRRALLKLGSGAIASVAASAAYVRDASAARRGWSFNPASLTPMPVFYLSPDCASIQCADQDEIRHSCNSCKACRSHSINKRWTSESAVVRAHDCCRCTVKQQSVPRVLYQEMFGSGTTARTEFDYRSLGL